MGVARLLAALPREVPIDLEPDDARDRLAEELAKQEYQDAKPTWFDNAIRELTDWMNGLQVGGAEGPPALGLLVILVVLATLVIVAFLIFGLPRLNRRSRVTGSLFGEDDARTSAAMRAAAEAAAASGDFSLAMAEMFRAIARGLAERTVLLTSPGTTASSFSTRAGRSFPAHAEALAAAATSFDEVRYLGGTGTRESFDAVARLERELRAAKPELEAVGS